MVSPSCRMLCAQLVFVSMFAGLWAIRNCPASCSIVWNRRPCIRKISGTTGTTYAVMLLATVMIFVGSCYATVQDGQVQLSSSADITITGERYPTADEPDKFAYAYYGIRYGTASRFEASVENTDFSYLQNASRLKQGPICPQRPGPPQNGPDAHRVQSEDCLYLDVYVPPITAGNASLLPVMMYMHGGALQIGTKDEFNSSALASAINAIIVTINYRVSVFGFLSTGDRAAAGNYGLGDCKLALQWIKKHIGRFGGDANAIAIFGQSAGGFLASAMLLDAQVRDSIRASLSLSQSVLMDSIMGQIPDHKKSAADLGTAVGCPVSTSDELILCLKRLPVQTLLSAAKGFESGSPNLVPYGLAIDGVHLPDEPLKAVEAASRFAVPGPNIVTGYLREDISLLLAVTNPELFNPNTTLTLASIKDIIARQFLTRGYTLWCPAPNYDLAQRVMDFYSFSNDDDRPTTLLKLFHAATDSVMAYPAVNEARLYAAQRKASNASTQLYRISHNPGYNGLGAFHLYDLANIFFPEQQLPGLILNPTVMNSIREMVRQVAHDGRMTGPDMRTEQYFELGQSGEWNIATFDQQSMVEFWDKITALNKEYNTNCAKPQPYSASY